MLLLTYSATYVWQIKHTLNYTYVCMSVTLTQNDALNKYKHIYELRENVKMLTNIELNKLSAKMVQMVGSP